MRSTEQRFRWFATRASHATARSSALLTRRSLLSAALVTSVVTLGLLGTVGPASAAKRSTIIVSGTVSVVLEGVQTSCTVPYPGVTVTASFDPASSGNAVAAVTALTAATGNYTLRLHHKGSWTISTNNPTNYVAGQASAPQTIGITGDRSGVNFTYVASTDGGTKVYKCPKKHR